MPRLQARRPSSRCRVTGSTAGRPFILNFRMTQASEGRGATSGEAPSGTLLAQLSRSPHIGGGQNAKWVRGDCGPLGVSSLNLPGFLKAPAFFSEIHGHMMVDAVVPQWRVQSTGSNNFSNLPITETKYTSVQKRARRTLSDCEISPKRTRKSLCVVVTITSIV